MEGIENELENKSIERDDPVESVEKKRTKKERSPAQIAAFEKARKKRAENLALKKEKKIKEPVIADENLIDNFVDEEPPPRKPIKTQSTRKQAIKSVDEYHDYPQQPKQPIINNYYYGTNNHDRTEPVLKKKSKKKKVQIVESSSEDDDSDEDYSPPPARPKKQIQRKQTPPQREPVEERTPEPPKLRYNFV